MGLGILLGALTGIAAAFGVLMNFNYLLAGTISINPVLGMLGLFLVFSWRVCGWIGVDRWLLPALGMPWKPGALFGATHPGNVSSGNSSSRLTCYGMDWRGSSGLCFRGCPDRTFLTGGTRPALR